MSTRHAKTPAQQRAARFDTLRMVAIMGSPRISAMMGRAGADVRIVGQWVWVEFSARPPIRVRTFLKALGFRWNRTREAWQHCCGVRSIHSPGAPRARYGSVPVSALAGGTDDDEKAVA